MAFNKFDPYAESSKEGRSAAERRALLLKYGWWVAMAYTAIGFGFIVYWVLGDLGY